MGSLGKPLEQNAIADTSLVTAPVLVTLTAYEGDATAPAAHAAASIVWRTALRSNHSNVKLEYESPHPNGHSTGPL